ncbi:Flp pilus assembly protein CpaB [Cereibacter azotoformans]|uniref:Flp pilus assembly protein CpaB n=1 Tax=Cereibacter azotoformans TaxID=43057 RepID=UPI000C6D4205|nr:Flp pilus assembly protein CpaB [Cereibacter azotoformans]
MRLIFLFVLMVGIALAGFAVYMAQGYISQTQVALEKEREARKRLGPMVEVFVTNKPLNYGAPLSREDVQKILWPANALPETIFKDETALFPETGKPRYVLRQMEKFEPVLAVKVTEPGVEAGLRLASGMRAFAIKVDVASGVSGFLQPGDRVDVYWTGAGANGETTRLIEKTIPIVAVDQTANADLATSAIIARTVTVEVSPQQVARLAQAQATGRLSLSLVGRDDTTEADAAPVDTRILIGEPDRIVEIEEKPSCTIRTRRGAELMESIPCTN